MIRIKTGAILLGLIIAFPLYAERNPEPDSIIYWSQENPLEWSDFRGPPDKNNPLYARTYYELHLKPIREDHQFHYVIINRFIPSQSWKKDTSKALLGHEQLHFDIAEIYARKMRRKINKLQQGEDPDPEAIMEVFENIYSDMEAYQQTYDRKTNHGLKSEAQQRWEQKVHQQLKDLQAYAVNYTRIANQVREQ